MSFDRLAPHYRWLEFVLAGEKLQRCRTAFLHRVAHCHDILLLGEGHGRFLLECRRQLPTAARITCVDASSQMLQASAARLLKNGFELQGVTFVQADVLHWKPPRRSFDLIVTQFFLDCFRPDQLGYLITKLAFSATSTAEWLIADFQVPADGWRRTRARCIHWLMYTFFRAFTRLPAQTLTPPDPFLNSAGFRLCSRQCSEWGLLHTDRWVR